MKRIQQNFKDVFTWNVITSDESEGRVPLEDAASISTIRNWLFDVWGRKLDIWGRKLDVWDRKLDVWDRMGWIEGDFQGRSPRHRNFDRSWSELEKGRRIFNVICAMKVILVGMIT